jgi:hypothetical protein
VPVLIVQGPFGTVLLPVNGQIPCLYTSSVQKFVECTVTYFRTGMFSAETCRLILLDYTTLP